MKYRRALAQGLLDSLPLAGMAATTRERAKNAGQAFIKTGYLRDVTAVAG